MEATTAVKAPLSQIRASLRTYRVMLAILVSPEWRHAVTWRASQQPGWIVGRHLPWLTFSAADYIREYLRANPSPYVFEYGSGASTLFWLDHGATVVSVEHDPEWHAEVHGLLPGQGRVDHRLVLPDGAPSDQPHDPADPALYQSDDERYRGMHFQSYVEQIDEFDDASFNIVLVDGRARPACVAHAAAKVAPGGLLVVDNSDRGYYLERTLSLLSDYEPHSFTGHCPGVLERTRTDVFLRRRTAVG